MSTLKIFCRLCAEEKPYSDIKSVTNGEDLRELIEKLTTFGISFVDFSNKMLPNTVCIVCFELLVASYEFFVKIRRSQEVLTEICGLQIGSEIVFDLPNCEAEEYNTHEAVKAESHDGDGAEYFQDCHSSSFEDTESHLKEEEHREIKVIEKATVADTPKDTILLIKHTENGTWDTYPWQCGLCNLKKGSIGALREHCRTKHLRCCAFKCVDCKKPLYCFKDFVEHVRCHRTGLRNYCEHCNLRIEGHTHADEYCTTCGEIFPDKTTLNLHLTLYPATQGLLHNTNIEIPYISFNTEIEIQNWAEYPAVCQFCDLKFVDTEVLTVHCIEAHKKCFGSQCVDCDLRVVCLEEFREHVKIHRPYLRNICPYCNENMGFENPAHIEEHTFSLHPCTLCGELYPSEQQLRKHHPLTPPKKRTGPRTEKDSTCEICGIIMKSLAIKKTHMKRHTDRNRDYTCDRCGKTYYTKGYLEEHYKIHDKKTQESCKICQKTFLTVTRLKKHVKTHNLELPFQCDGCKKFFSSKDRIREHVKVHMDIKPFACRYCSKKFRYKCIMKTHEHQHTGARPYSCNVCCMDFANWSNCNKHMKRKHGTTLAKSVMTPHGKLALNPSTGRPEELVIDHVAKEWSVKMLKRRRKRMHIETETT